MRTGYVAWFLVAGAMRLAAQTPATEVLQGELLVLVEDHFEQRTSVTHYRLKTATNGLGPVAPAIGDGLDSSDQLRTAPPTIVFIGGVPAQVPFAGLAPQFVGVNQINVVVPSGIAASDAVPLVINSGGIITSDKVTIAVAGK
jgi:uncharacterized protein (TIGR03437 family)